MTKKEFRGTVEYSLVFSELITAAKYRGTVTYQEIAKIIGLPLTGNYMGSVIGDLLGAISEDEVSCGRPMLSAIAVGVGGGPGAGFFNLAKQQGRMTGEDKQAFWAAERDAVYETWKVVLTHD